MPALFEPWVSGSTAQAVLSYAHYLSPPIIFLVFLTCFISRSVIKANRDNELKPLPQQTGPGGKPLPRTNSPSAKRQLLKTACPDFSPARKSLFIILHVLLLLTFVGNATIIVIHALAKREQEWWCGQAFVVSGRCPFTPHERKSLIVLILDLCRGYFLHIFLDLDIYHRHSSGAKSRSCHYLDRESHLGHHLPWGLICPVLDHPSCGKGL